MHFFFISLTSLQFLKNPFVCYLVYPQGMLKDLKDRVCPATVWIKGTSNALVFHPLANEGKPQCCCTKHTRDMLFICRPVSLKGYRTSLL